MQAMQQQNEIKEELMYEQNPANDDLNKEEEK